MTTKQKRKEAPPFRRNLLLLCLLFAIVATSILPICAAGAPTVLTLTVTDITEYEAVGTLTVDETGYNVYRLLFDATEHDGLCFNLSPRVPLIKTHKLGEKTADFRSDLATRKKKIEKNEADFTKSTSFFEATKNEIVANPGKSITSSDGATPLLFQVVKSDTRQGIVEIQGFLIVEWSAGELVLGDLDKTKLQASLDKVTGTNESKWYTSNDRYNGKAESKTGFWAELTKTNGPRANAQNILNTALIQKQLDNAQKDLDNAISNLIPAERANTTLLYEEIQRNEKLNKDNYTPKSWSAFSQKLDAAQTLQASMFNEDGSPSNVNKVSEQQHVEGMASELKTAREKLELRIAKEDLVCAEFAQKAIRQLLDEQPKGAYTPESWSAYQSKRTAAEEALNTISVFESMGTEALTQLTDALQALHVARYALVDADKSTITVHLSLFDAYAVFDGQKPLNSIAKDVTLSPGATVREALSAANVALPSETVHGGYGRNLVFINGQLFYEEHAGINQGRYCFDGQFSTAKLRDGDRLTIVNVFAPYYLNSSEDGTGGARAMSEIQNMFRYTTIKAPEKVAAGQTFEITVTATGAVPSNYTEAAAYANAKIFTSAEAYETAGAAATAAPTLDTYVTTDANGKASLTLYNEGFVTLNVYSFDDAGRVTAGHTVIIEVGKTDDLQAIRLQLREELDNAYNDEAYPRSVFSAEQWTELQTAYNTGIAGIADAKTSGEARTAQMAALQTIKRLQSEADKANADNLRFFRNLLATLPYPTDGKLDAAAKDTVERLINRYNAMTAAQQNDLTDEEQAKYKAISEASFTETAQQFDLSFEQKFAAGVKDEDKATIEAMVKYLQGNTPNEDWYKQDQTSGVGNQKLAALFTFNTTKSANSSTAYQKITESSALQSGIYACVNPDYIMYLLCRDNSGVFSGTTDTGAWSVSDANTTLNVTTKNGYSYVGLVGKMVYTINGTQYAIRSIDVEGLTAGQYELTTRPFYEGSDYKGKTDTDCNLYVPNSFVSFTMPFNDVKVSVTWGPVSGTDSEVEKARADALTALNAVFGKYDETHENYTAIKAAYDKGVSAINAAQTVDAINAARRDAAKEMAKAAAGNTETSKNFYRYWNPDGKDYKGFNAGTPAGSVTVIIEDTTYQDATGHFYSNPADPNYNVKTDSIVYEENYTIGDNDSMMTVILRALKENEYTWTGTGGDEYEIGYLSGIKDADNCVLAEFTGGDESGWMGTLNGFFTNLGFSEFKVKGSPNTNIRLEDGDVIRVMYTCTGLGKDLGGTWGNSDTTLKALKVENGTETLVLAPEFEAVAEPGGTYSYTVLIDDEAAELTITADAANKNYLVKRFLNEKVTDNTEGGSFYKSTQAIPVVSGDTIYIGCGEPVWPSMNNQGTEAREYVGTWYELHIVSKKSGTKDVEAQIDALPDVGSLTYANRENYRQDILQAWRSLYELADPSAVSNKDKLDQLYKKLTDFDAVDAVKKAIADLPTVSNATLADKGDIDAAKAKYDALTDELRTYLKASEKQKLADLLKRIEELNQEALTRLVVSPDTVSAVVDAKTGTIRLVGYVPAGTQITLNGTSVANGDSFTLGYSTYRIDMSGVIEKAPNVELEEKRPEIKMPEDAGDDVKQAVNAITSPSTTSDGLKEAAAETLTETAKELAKEAAAEAGENQTVEVTAEVNLKIEVTSYRVSDGKNELVLEIKPQVTYTTVMKNADGTTASSETTDAEDLDNHVINAPVTISLALPTGMSQENLYVKHQISEDRYEYIKPTIKKNVATWQQSSFSIVVLTSDLRTVTIEMDGVNETLTPEDIGKELPTVSMPNKDFLGWTFVIGGVEYPGGPYTELTDNLLTALSEAESVSATPVFKDRPIIPVTPVTPSKPSQKPDTGKDLPFTDVSANNWFYDGVKYAYENGLMNGTSSNAFSPNANTTRGMIVTILARVEGVNTNGTPWYAAGQKWAMDNGISDGTNMIGEVTREQLAAILYRYAKQKGYDVSKSAALTAFSDADKVSGYAAESMQWAVAEGLLQGSNGKLNPQGSATRAQVATILMRFMEKIEK